MECIGCEREIENLIHTKQIGHNEYVAFKSGPMCAACLGEAFAYEARKAGIIEKDRQFIRKAAIEAMNANIIGVLVNAKDVKNDTKYLENVALKSAVEFAQLLLIEVKRYEIEIKKHKRECK